jgi:hypothetical protein
VQCATGLTPLDSMVVCVCAMVRQRQGKTGSERGGKGGIGACGAKCRGRGKAAQMRVGFLSFLWAAAAGDQAAASTQKSGSTATQVRWGREEKGGRDRSIWLQAGEGLRAEAKGRGRKRPAGDTWGWVHWRRRRRGQQQGASKCAGSGGVGDGRPRLAGASAPAPLEQQAAVPAASAWRARLGCVPLSLSPC